MPAAGGAGERRVQPRLGGLLWRSVMRCSARVWLSPACWLLICLSPFRICICAGCVPAAALWPATHRGMGWLAGGLNWIGGVGGGAGL